MVKGILRTVLACAFMVVGTAAALAQAYNPEEVAKLRAFLNQPSAVAGKTNGQTLNAAFDENNPATYNVDWSSDAIDKRVSRISWGYRTEKLNGSFVISSFTKVAEINLNSNSLSNVAIDNCPLLKYLYLENVGIQQFNVTT